VLECKEEDRPVDNILTIESVRDMLRAKVKEAGSQVALAAQMDVSSVYISRVLRAKQAPSPLILRALRLKRITVYQAE